MVGTKSRQLYKFSGGSVNRCPGDVPSACQPCLIYNMRIPDDVKKSVVFIGVEVDDGHGGKKIRFCGTGFFVSVASQYDANKSWLYLVTAKHVVVELNARQFFVRANSNDGGTITFKGEGDLKWIFHPDDSSADVAVFQMVIPQDFVPRLDMRPLSHVMFMTDKEIVEQNIGVGDDVFVTGLFSFHHGKLRNNPIIRTGHIAMMPEELIPTKKLGDMKAYLIELRSTGGLSGSPVFVLKQYDGGLWRQFLFGLVHGHWEIGADSVMDASLESGKQSTVNAGVAIVTPAHKILETLDAEPLLDIRRRGNEHVKKEMERPK
jgi:hypothetical protein